MEREVEEEVEMRMRRAEREEESYAKLLHSTGTNTQVSNTFQHGASTVILICVMCPSGFTRKHLNHTVIQTLFLAQTPVIFPSRIC